MLETNMSYCRWIVSLFSLSDRFFLTYLIGEGSKILRQKPSFMIAPMVFILLVTLSSGSLSAAEIEGSLASKSRSADHEATLESLRTGGLEARGVVLDSETGQPIRDVQMVVTKGYFGEGSPLVRKTERIRQTVDGSFHFRCEPCIDLHVSFTTDGYREESVHLGGIEARLRSSVENESEATFVGNILLEPLWNPVRLQRYRARLVVDADPTTAQVFVFEGARGQEMSWHRVQERARNSSEPLRYLRLVTATDASGQPEAVLEEGSRYSKIAATAKIDLSSADGGIIVYDSMGMSPVELRRKMIEAPASGYQQYLQLDPKADGPVSFFVRIGDRFGRGAAYPPVLEQTSTGQRLVATVELHLNPDGTRNLETLE